MYLGPKESFSQLGRPWNICGIPLVFPTESNRVVLLSPKNRGFVKAHPLTPITHHLGFFFETPHCDRPLKDIGSMEMDSFECGMWNPQAWGVVFVVSSSVPPLSSALRWMDLSLTEVPSSKNWNPSLEVLLWVHTAKVVGKLLFDWNIGYESSFKQNALKPQPFVAAFHCHPLQLTVGVEHLHVGWSHNTSTCDKRRIQAMA